MSAQTKTCLLISSDVELQTVVDSRLKARNFVVQSVSSIGDSLHCIEHETPDLILLDAEVEKVSESELLSKIKTITLSLCIPLILIAQADRLSSLIMCAEQGFDDFITKPVDAFQLVLRVTINLKRMEDRGQVNPLSKLPGNSAINRKIEQLLEVNEPFSVCYMDINNFKAFNDCYGYSKGDDVIKQTARILLGAIREFDPSGKAFIGHVGGDDFVAIVSPDYEEKFSNVCMKEFDRLIPTHYNEEDRKRGSVRVENRKGQMETFDLMGLSIAAVTNLKRKFKNVGEISRSAAEVKKFLKTQSGGSHYLRDRREEPVEKIEEAQLILAKTSPVVRPQRLKEPLGQALVASGLLSNEKLEEALKKHLQTGQKLGQVLIGMRCVKSEDVGKTLERKTGIPYVNLNKTVISNEMAHLFPLSFIQTHRALAIRREKEVLYVGMVDPYDSKEQHEIEQWAACPVRPCWILEDELETFLKTRFSSAFRGRSEG